MSADPAEIKKITLRTADNEEFDVDEAVAMKLVTVREFFDENPDASNAPIPLPNVSSKSLPAIIAYCKYHLAHSARHGTEKEAKEHDEDLVKGQSNEELIELILAVNYLNIKDMLDMLNQAAADRIKNKSVKYVRKFFGVETDYTPDEEAVIRSQNEWAFEGVDADEDD